MKSNYVFLLLLLLGLGSCKSSQKFTNDPAKTKELRDRIDLMLSSTNKGDFDQLEKIYADDFAGLSPVVTFKKKSELIESLRKNYKENPTHIEADKIEVHTGILIGYALLNWRIYTINPVTSEKQLIFNKPVMQIWQRHQKKQVWQITRVLFYQPDRPFGEIIID